MQPLDWYIFVALLIGLLALGWWFRRYMRSVADFIVVNRGMRKYLGLSTWGAEGIGLASIAYLTEQGFTKGLGLAWMTLLNLMLYIPLFGILGFGIRRFRATCVQTIPQYHEMRFSQGVRICNGLVLATGGILNMAIFPVVSSHFLVRFMALPDTVNFLGQTFQTVHVCMLVLISVSLWVALMGGMVTVIVTDYVQAVILAFAIFSIVGLAVYAVGLEGIDRTLQENFGEAGFNPFVTTETGGGYGLTWVAFFLLSWMLAPLCFPPSTAKIASTDSTDTTRKLALLGQFLNSSRSILVLLLGVCALAAMGAAIPEGADAAHYSRYASAQFMHDITPTGLLGLCAAGMLFAYVTTDNSYYLAWAAIVVNDILVPLHGRPLSQRAHIWLLRLIMICIAVLLFCWGLFYKLDESLLEYIYLTGAIMSAAGIVTLFGLYWKRANSAGAYATVVICMVVPIADLIGKKIFDNYPLKGHQSGLLALVLSFAVFLVCGLASRSGEAKWQNFGLAVREEDRLRRAGKEAKHV